MVYPSGGGTNSLFFEILEDKAGHTVDTSERRRRLALSLELLIDS